MPEEIKKSIEKFLEAIIKPITSKYKIEFLKEADQWRVNIIATENDQEALLGYQEEVIQAIQHLVRVMVHKENLKDRTHFLIDVNNYRKKRESKIKFQIPEIAKDKVLVEGKTVIITGLSGYERMIIHKILKEAKGLDTSSVGHSIDRKLLIMPTSEFGASGMEEAVIINVNKLD